MENSPLPINPLESNLNSSGNNFFMKSVLISFLFLVFFVFLFYFLFLTAPNNFPNQVILNISRGETLKSISKDLKEQQIIRSKVLFETFIIIYGDENHISEGDYLFENKLPVFEVARRISKRDRHLAPVKVTIPEGFDVIQISEMFSSKLKNFNKDLFLIEAKKKEGYLFPDTYFFNTTDNEQNVLNYMSENFNKKTQPFVQKILSSGKSKSDIINMASIIEREAKGDNDRGIISGILWNRISKKMPLQVDAALETYKERGLPQNPICNPGLEAIEASLKPVKSNYLYYLHDKNGLIHFAVTFTEHKQNIQKYLK